ncbi:polysaccharide biosynthesis C-terminal domain-containing protein [Cytophagaceae bacterium ABcell3]|nr:polysaccharide biosynthesis C-terminal domain-containing protein [Cytophagaceae bacterium ABcell3]
MGIIQRQSFIATLLSYTGIIIGYVNVALLFPKFFEPEHLGLRSVLMEFSLIMAQISLLGFRGVITRYFPYFKNEAKKHNGFLFFVILVPLLGFILLSTIALIFREQIFDIYVKTSPLIYEYYPLIFVISFFMLLSIIFEIYAAYFNIVVSNLIRDVFLRLSLSILILLFILDIISINLFWYLFAATYAIAFLMLVVYVNSIGQLLIKLDLRKFKGKILKDIASFSAYGFFGSTAALLVFKIDTVMISYIMQDLAELGIYSLALYIASVIEVPKRALLQISSPILSNAFKNDDHQLVKDLYHKSSLNQMIVGGYIFLVLWTGIDAIFSIIPNSHIYSAGKWPLLFVGLAKLFDMATGNNSEIINYSKYYRYHFYFTLTLVLLTIATNFIFIPIYGITGAAMATALSVLVFNTCKYIFIVAKFRIQPFTVHTPKVLLLGIIAYFIAGILPETEHAVLNLFITATAITVIYLFPILYFKISPELTDLVLKVLKRKA